MDLPLSSPDLILASASPRRRELLERVGLALQVLPVDIDETPQAGERAREYVERMAKQKCEAAVSRFALDHPSLSILAADTVVTLGGQILGKAADEAEATAMLKKLAGRRHEVMTAYCAQLGDRAVSRTVTTGVTFRLLDPAELRAYVESGEWKGKAGAYAIQGIAGAFATDIRGSFSNVVGLPLAEVIADLRALEAIPAYPRAGFGGRV